jgi:hypothetical protein
MSTLLLILVFVALLAQFLPGEAGATMRGDAVRIVLIVIVLYLLLAGGGHINVEASIARPTT